MEKWKKCRWRRTVGRCCPSWYLSFLLILSTPVLSGCILTYGIKSGIGQFKILKERRPLNEVIDDPTTSQETKEKLIVARKAREFAETELGFKPTKNYTHYVKLNRPYVTWIVSKAHKYKLEYEHFSFPVLGKLPYKGYFSKQEALEAQAEINSEKYDTWVRGVSAYSTLGWFQDPLLSSMLRGSKADVVELVLHESAHATLYIKSAADFNEQLATYLGQEAAKRYFQNIEGLNSPSIKELELQKHDQKIFSLFLKKEIKDLKAWYVAQKEKPSDDLRNKRLSGLQNRFQSQISKKLKTSRYKYFPKLELNNAILLGIGTYLEDLNIFSRLMQKKNGNIKDFINYCESLENEEKPTETLKTYLNKEG